MGRRKRKVLRSPKRRLPLIYLCPKCGEQAVKVTLKRKESRALVQCGKCGLKEDLTAINRLDQPIDIYCKFTDRYYASIHEIT